MCVHSWHRTVVTLSKIIMFNLFFVSFAIVNSVRTWILTTFHAAMLNDRFYRGVDQWYDAFFYHKIKFLV